MSALAIESLSKTCPGGKAALADVSLSIGHGEFFCVVGPTNAGKSTLLKTIAGLHRPDRGRIVVGGRDVTALEPRERRLSLLFQNNALFPTHTGFENIAFPLRIAGRPESEIEERVNALAGKLKVSHVLGRRPSTFSGGEQRRVAIGRALAAPSDALLLDEPLTNLDARIRIGLRIEFKALHRDLGQTFVYVTHDHVEAFSLSDRIAVLRDGKVEQVGAPDEIYRRPVNRFVATFVGSPPMNIIPAELVGDGDGLAARGDGFEVPLALQGLRSPRPDRRIALGIRPEEVRVAAAASAETPFAAEVRWVERLGARHVLDLAVGDEIVRAMVKPDHPVDREGRAFFGFKPGAEHVLDPATDRFIRP
jgi:ABC-type sugar transport system ATPase subunit